MLTCLFTLCAMILLSACAIDGDTFAPVSEVSTFEPIPKKGVHRVIADETLYSIAWRYGLDYETLAKLNRITPPYQIHSGQLIYLIKKNPKKTPLPKPNIKTKPIPPASIPNKKPEPMLEREPIAKVNTWNWPAKGPVIGSFGKLNKGINISGQLGDPIYATAAGKIVYSGSGLRGYGNLIIIKHNSNFLSAYAHNSTVFIKDGDWVRAGQKIAEMGNTGSQKIMLHFEMRRHGQPVNPLIYLAKKI